MTDRVLEVTLRDGRIVTGWRAVLYALPLVPVVAVYVLIAVLYGVVLFTARWITGRDSVLGWTYDGKGTWTRQP